MSLLLGQDPPPSCLFVLRMVHAALPAGNMQAAGMATEGSLSPPLRDFLGVCSVTSPLSHPSLPSTAASSLSA